MNTDELLTELDVAYKSIHKISNAIASKEGLTDNPDFQYLISKMRQFRNTTDHIVGQLKSQEKEHRLMRKRNQK